MFSGAFIVAAMSALARFARRGSRPPRPRSLNGWRGGASWRWCRQAVDRGVPGRSAGERSDQQQLPTAALSGTDPPDLQALDPVSRETKGRRIRGSSTPKPGGSFGSHRPTRVRLRLLRQADRRFRRADCPAHAAQAWSERPGSGGRARVAPGLLGQPHGQCLRADSGSAPPGRGCGSTGGRSSHPAGCPTAAQGIHGLLTPTNDQGPAGRLPLRLSGLRGASGRTMRSGMRPQGPRRPAGLLRRPGPGPDLVRVRCTHRLHRSAVFGSPTGSAGHCHPRPSSKARCAWQPAPAGPMVALQPAPEALKVPSADSSHTVRGIEEPWTGAWRNRSSPKGSWFR